MYRIAISGNKKAALLAWTSAVGYGLPDIISEEGTEENYTLVCEISTRHDGNPYEGEEPWNGELFPLEELSEAEIRDPGFVSPLFGKGLSYLTACLHVDVKMVNIPDDEDCPVKTLYHYADGKELEFEMVPLDEEEEADAEEEVVDIPEGVPRTFEELKEFFFDSYVRKECVHIKDLDYDFAKKVKALYIPGIIDGMPVVVDDYFQAKYSGCNMAKKLEEVIFLEGVAEIGSNAFFQCARLKRVTFAKSIKKVGTFAFYETPWEEEQGDWRTKFGF